MGEDREERERDLKTEAIVFLSLSLRGDILSLPPYSIHSSTIFYPFFHHILSSEAGEEIQPHSRRGDHTGVRNQEVEIIEDPLRNCLLCPFCRWDD